MTVSAGSVADGTVADVFTVRDGQVIRMQAYADPAQALGAGHQAAPDESRVMPA